MTENPRQTEKTTIAASWDQSGFERLLAGFSADRRADDEAHLTAIFNRMARVPSAAAALEWAQAHNVRFFVDRTVKGAGGYYTPGTGVVAVAAPYHLTPDFAASILVHEIRHAWQDAQGLLAPPVADFATYSIQNALIEADAYAYETLTKAEVRLQSDKAAYRKYEDRQLKGELPKYAQAARDRIAIQEKALADKGAYLVEAFYGWFNGSRAYSYGHSLMQSYGATLGLSSEQPKNRFYEFSPAYTGHAPNIAGELGTPLGDGMDVTSFKSVLRLGRGFAGEDSYLARTTRDDMMQSALNPRLALSFYRAANDEQCRLNQKIQEETLKTGFAAKVRSGLGKG